MFAVRLFTGLLDTLKLLGSVFRVQKGIYTTQYLLSNNMIAGKTGSLGWQKAWDNLPLKEKLIWMIFIGNTIGLFTLIEILIFK